MIRKKPRLSLSKRKAIVLLILFIIIGVIGTALFPLGISDITNEINALDGKLNPFPVDRTKPLELMLSSEVTWIDEDANLSME